MRGTDPITHVILDIVQEFMLVDEASRHSATGIVKIMADKMEMYQHAAAESSNEIFEFENVLMATSSRTSIMQPHNSIACELTNNAGCQCNSCNSGLPRLKEDFKSSRDRLLSQPVPPIIRCNDHRLGLGIETHAPSFSLAIETANPSYLLEHKGVVDMWMVESELEAMQRSKSLSILGNIRNPTPRSVKDKKSRSKCDELESFSKDRDIVSNFSSIPL
jgi:hypothetical protein